MLFVRTSELKQGMRIARPIYNKNGVLLYERDTRLTLQGIYSIRNFGLIGIFILEPAEPVPPMTKEDIDFERFQTMSVFTIKEIFGAVKTGKRAVALPTFVSDIMRAYGRLDHKINFMQNLRSKEDEAFKHALNTAVLAALISNQLRMTNQEQIKIIMAGLLYQSDYSNYNLDEGVKQLIFQMYHKINALKDGNMDMEISRIAEVTLVASEYDNLTAMKLDEEPTSEVGAIRFLMNAENGYSKEVVRALIDSVDILTPGVCVELTNGGKAVVLNENKANVLRPLVLSFYDNTILDLYHDKVFQQVQIKDIMKSMDNRFIMDRELVENAQKEMKID